MIELLLKAEHALALGLLDQAERVYWQAVEHDPRNAIAIVGLSRVALERGDEWTAMDFAARALAVDPDNATARRLMVRLDEVIKRRGDGPRGKPDAPAVLPVSPTVATTSPASSAPPSPTWPASPASAAAPVSPASPAAVDAPPSVAAPDSMTSPTSPASPGSPAPAPAPKRRGLLTRLLRR